jgi:hypothetical protein
MAEAKYWLIIKKVIVGTGRDLSVLEKSFIVIQFALAIEAEILALRFRELFKDCFVHRNDRLQRKARPASLRETHKKY